jgi:hypothetical protein
MTVAGLWDIYEENLKTLDTKTIATRKSIVKKIRSQRFSDTARDCTDLVSFWALAGAGTAETANLMGEHINFEKCEKGKEDTDGVKGEIRLFRKKTDTGFTIPLFPAVRPLLERLR